jgi:hypothetical protein
VIGQRWGVTDAEVARFYPCDELVPDAPVQLWRGVTVLADPATVWLWLRQVQLAPYSYDWVDNLGRPSPRELRDVVDPLPGQHFTMTAGRWKVGEILTVEPGVHLTASILGAVMSYVVVPDQEGTRLLLKIVLPAKRWWSSPLALGDWPMARKQLLTLKRLAEG